MEASYLEWLKRTYGPAAARHLYRQNWRPGMAHLVPGRFGGGGGGGRRWGPRDLTIARRRSQPYPKKPPEVAAREREQQKKAGLRQRMGSISAGRGWVGGKDELEAIHGWKRGKANKPIHGPRGKWDRLPKHKRKAWEEKWKDHRVVESDIDLPSGGKAHVFVPAGSKWKKPYINRKARSGLQEQAARQKIWERAHALKVARYDRLYYGGLKPNPYV